MDSFVYALKNRLVSFHGTFDFGINSLMASWIFIIFPKALIDAPKLTSSPAPSALPSPISKGGGPPSPVSNGGGAPPAFINGGISLI